MPDGITTDLRNRAATDPALAAEALAGLRRPGKTLPPKFFYDEQGCELFDAITRLPEYYVTRTELALLRAIAPELAAAAPHGAALVEYGACDETKAAILLPHLLSPSAYVPIDVAGPALAALKSRMQHSHRGLPVHPIEADFHAALRLPAEIARHRLLGFFPGSTIGNMDPDEAHLFLLQARRTLGAGTRFIVGADLRKDPALLVPAYDDAAGVTARFNLNLLVRLNREAAADFDLHGFAHRALWNDEHGRIEMHLVSLREQTASVAGETISFAAGESIHTENSYKHTEEGFSDLAAASGWRPVRCWTDPGRLFSVHMLEAEE